MEMDNDIEYNDQTKMMKAEIVEINKPNKIKYEANYLMFFIVITIGFNVMIFSTLFLPLVFLFPFYYVSIFSTGSLITLYSFRYIYGTTSFSKMLFEENRRFLTWIYIGSIICGLFFSSISKNFWVCSNTITIQIVMLCVFMISFIPLVETAFSFIWKHIKPLLVFTYNKIF